jgi:hypothetical protein
MRISLGLVVATSCLACTVEPDSVSETNSAVVIDNRLAANRLAANRLAANRLAANRLAANRLAANRLELDPIGSADLITTPEGREVLSFIVSCAMPDDVTLEGTHAGVTYEFFGELGLAPRWEKRRLDRKGKGWVSACLFSRVNAFDVPIPVSLRGAHGQLTSTPDERATWSLEEGAFYGDYFTRDDEEINWIACRGRDQAAGEAGGLLQRDCAEPDPANPGRTLCGFKFAGDCGDWVSKPVCKKFNVNGTYYQDCSGSTKKHHKGGGGHHDDDDDDDGHHHDDDDDGGHHHDDDDDCGNHGWRNKRYQQVITTFVIP